jgi:hypothetical protein
MVKLIALLAAAGAFAAAVFFWRKQGEPSVDSMWSSAEDALSSWGETAANEAGSGADAATKAAAEVNDTIAHTKEPGGS